jgi:Rrf2 family iron-sulfur cluster assembly transcriptional regulator
MFCLSESVGYSIKALSCLEDDSSGPRTIKEIANCSGVPSPYLAKLVKKLVDAGILASRRGTGGGAWLDRSASTISVLEISEAIDGSHILDRCLLGFDTCSDDRSCPTHAFWKVEREGIRKILLETTLADVIEHGKTLNQKTEGPCGS